MIIVFACARCAETNHPSTRFCIRCKLPLGRMEPDAGVAADALGPYEAPEPADPDAGRSLHKFVAAAGYERAPSGHGWRLIVPLDADRRQVVYIGHAGTDPDGRPILALVSICGPATDRDARTLLKLNARLVECHFAIKTLRGEEYFVVLENLPVELIDRVDPAALVRRVAETADQLEDRLSRGLDLY